MKVKTFFEMVGYQVTDSYKFLWQCFGPNATGIEYWNGKHGDEGCSVSVVFDAMTAEVYEMQAWDYSTNREYRWFAPGCANLAKEEAASRNLDYEESIDGRHFIDLDLEEDILEKAHAIYAGEEYDTRVMVNIDLPDDLLHTAMRTAHEMDITLNQYIERILVAEIKRLKNEIVSNTQ